MPDDPPPPSPSHPDPMAPQLQVGPPPGAIAGLAAEEKQWAMFVHLSALLCMLTAVPGLGIVAPLILWTLKKDTMPFVNDQGKEAMNFQILPAIGVAVGWLLTLTCFGFPCLGLPLLGLILIGSAIFCLIASIKAAEGVPFRYPLSLRLIS